MNHYRTIQPVSRRRSTCSSPALLLAGSLVLGLSLPLAAAHPALPLTREARTVKISPGFESVQLKEAVAAINDGQFDEALQRFEALDDVTLRLTGIAFVLGDLDYYERPVYGLGEGRSKQEPTEAELAPHFGELGVFAARWESELKRHPDNAMLNAYRGYMRHVGRMVLNRAYRQHAEAVAALDARVSPFHYKAQLYLARSLYWDGAEGGRQDIKEQARARMRNLMTLWPDNRVLREYAGEPVAWGEDLNADTQQHPGWAAYLREAYAREIAVMERSCDLRQMPDGQLGGGWGDDVELLRRWAPVAAISSCSGKITRGIEKLAEGIWIHRLQDGYDKGIGDVEHSAEPSADSLPIMMLLRYGDARWVERNLRSCKTIKEKFTGIDAKGFPRFLSSYFGADGVAKHTTAGGDTAYNARAMKHFLWTAWYGNTEARDFYLRWVDGWRAMCMQDAPDKPAGVLPGSIFFPSGSHQPPNNEPWFRESSIHLYGAIGLPAMIHDCFLAAYGFSGDAKFLKPVQRMMDWATLGPLVRDQDHARLEPGTRDWFRLPLAHTTRATHTALYRLLTGERVYDEYTRRFGTPPQLYQIDHDLTHYMKAIEAAARSLRTNLWFRTTEVQSTDRLDLPAVEAVFGAYTGAILLTGDTDFQTFAVTYDTPSADFAALVVENTPARLRVWFYSFWDEPTPITLRVWQLQPGEYLLNAGERVKGEFPFQHRYQWGEPRRVPVLHRATPVPLVVPPGVEYVVDLRLDEPLAVPPTACDLAIHGRDIAVQGNLLTLTIHNIGNAPAEDFAVALQQCQSDNWQTLQTQRVPLLSPPAELTPTLARASFHVPQLDLEQRYRFVVDPEERIREICETNNVADLPGQRIEPLAAPPAGVNLGIAGLPSGLDLDLGDGLKIELVLMAPGEFAMGLPNAEPRAAAYERPSHQVRIDRPFYIGKYEITQAQWQRVMNDNPAHFKGNPRLPVEMVSWDMAQAFCECLSRRIWRRVRLPSEAEWEYACRAGSTAYWSHGDDIEQLADYAWYGVNSDGRTHVVGQKKPNAWGLYDMHGNVREWCLDWFEPYPATQAPPQEFAEPRQRILRGGSWDWIEPANQGSARRDRAAPTARRDHYGLRIVADPRPESPNR